MTIKEAIAELDRERKALMDEMEQDDDKWCTDYIEALGIAVEAMGATYDDNSDLVSRQEVISLLKSMRKDGNMIPWEGKDVFKAIREIPPANLEPLYMAHYRQGRADEAAERDGRLMQAFNPD